MTTNQTIDGVLVPRGMLENCASYLEGSASGTVKLWHKELRALLDAPAHCAHDWADDGEFTLTCPKCSKKENHEPYGWVQTRGDALNHFTQEWDVVESWVERGFEYKAMFDQTERDREKTVAQPQGEPAAWDIHWRDNGEFYFTLRNQSRLWKYEQDPDFKVVPLYAEQPAPVAMCDCNQGRFPCNGRCKP